MGAGKSLIGQSLAQRLNIPFYDLDKQIETLQGCSVSDFFKIHGEMEFRKEETRVMKEIVNHNNEFVIATGGGTPCFHNNMKWMNENGTTVYLNISKEALGRRLKREKLKRPLIANLSNEDIDSFIEKLLHERAGTYGESKFEISPEKYTPGILIETIIRLLTNS